MVRSIHGTRRHLSARRGGFTLVEILIVVIILGILAAIVIPQFTNASTSARASSVTSQLQTLRSQIQLFKLQHNDTLPTLLGTSPACWSQLMSKTNISGTVDSSAAGVYGPYLETAPKNPLNNNADVAAIGAQTSTTGWQFDTTNGNIYATNQTATLSFDESTGTVQ
jgi:general secretion pathway protein G